MRRRKNISVCPEHLCPLAQSTWHLARSSAENGQQTGRDWLWPLLFSWWDLGQPSCWTGLLWLQVSSSVSPRALCKRYYYLCLSWPDKVGSTLLSNQACPPLPLWGSLLIWFRAEHSHGFRVAQQETDRQPEANLQLPSVLTTTPITSNSPGETGRVLVTLSEDHG